METFFTEYAKQLEIAMRDFPDDYMPGIALTTILERMKIALQKGSYNKDSRSFKATCKALGIKHTYTAINSFIANHV